MTDRLKPAENHDLREQVYHSIKNAIVNGTFKPGEKLSEVDLANQLEVSRTPVREAIRQLAKTGLVSLLPRKGAFVAQPSKTDAMQLYALREHLESYVVTLVAQNPPTDRLEGFRTQFTAMGRHTPSEVYLEADRQFHNFLYEHAGNRFLRDTLLNLQDLINLYRPYSTLESNAIELFVADHLKVIDALLSGRNDQVSREMSLHIQHTFEMISEALS